MSLNKGCSFCFIIAFGIFNSKTSVVTNLKPFNSVNESISLFLITDSVSL